jgi:hypothetical protein
MARAPASAPLLDWPRLSELASLGMRRREVLAELEKVRPRSERFFVLRARLRELTEQQLRLGTGGGNER